VLLNPVGPPQEYQDTLERTRQEQEGTYETPLCYTIPDEEKNKELWEAPPVKDFDPPYLRGGVEGRQMAKAIGTKRTPIGNLHTTSNPALYLPVVPSYVPFLTLTKRCHMPALWQPRLGSRARPPEGSQGERRA
jgi:hypothetical protein